jgi:hypothetical protein
MMPRQHEPGVAPGRRRFLLGALTLPAAAALGGCSGAPQNVPSAAAPPIAPLPPTAAATPASRGSALHLEELREFRLAEGIEPAVVFRASWGR